jgi:hypothetical protein
MEIRHLEDDSLLVRKVFIFRHDFVNLKLDSAVLKKTYFFEDKQYPNGMTEDDVREHNRAFLNKMKKNFRENDIFVLDFNLLNGINVHGAKTQLEKYGVAFWLVVSFFDDDETILKNAENPDAIIEKKVNMLEDMMFFPYIQKRETPEGGIITESYLSELFEENFLKNMEIVPAQSNG